MTSPSSTRAFTGLALAAGLALGLAGCGSDGSPTTAGAREAAADTTCPAQRGFSDNYFTFMNDLDTDVTLVVPRDSWSCDGFSGVSTPGNLSGRVIGHPGPQPRIRMESHDEGPGTRFTMTIQAAGATLATIEISRYTYMGPTYPWGIMINGENRCYRPVVELKDPGGGSAGWLTMPKPCGASARGDVVFQFTKTKPWT